MEFASAVAKINELFERIDETPIGPEERALIDEAIRLTQEIEHEPLEYQARLRLNASAAMSGDTDTLLTSFAWCLAKHDADPESFPTEVGGGDIMWQFKWITDVLVSSPIFPLSQSEAALDDMEAHYRKEGLGLSGVAMARFTHAWYTGDFEKAAELREVLLITPHDDYSHCNACTRSELSGFALATGDESEALRLVDEIIEGNLSCGDEPEMALSRTLIARLRAGQLDQAREDHLRSYRLSSSNPDKISIVAHNMVFCAVTGNEARGLSMVERHLPWLAHDALNADGQLGMLRAVALVLSAVERAGFGDQQVRGAQREELKRFFGDPPGADGAVGNGTVGAVGDSTVGDSTVAAPARWTVTDLALATWAAAERLAIAFDERNGNTIEMEEVENTRGLLETHFEVPIHTDAFVTPPTTVREPVTVADRLEHARVLVATENVGAGLSTLHDLLDDTEANLTPAQRARAIQLLMWALLTQGDQASAESLLAERVSALRAEGRQAQAELEERLGIVIFDSNAPDAVPTLSAELERMPAGSPERADVEISLAQAILRKAQAEFEQDRAQQAESDSVDGPAHSVPSFSEHLWEQLDALAAACIEEADDLSSLQLSAIDFRAMIRMNHDDKEEALTLLNRVLESADDAHRQNALMNRARLLGQLERFSEGVESAEEAVAILMRHGVRGGALLNALSLASGINGDAGHHDKALQYLRLLLREAELAEIPTNGIRFGIGRLLLQTGSPQEAAEVLWQVREDEQAIDEPPASQAQTAMLIAQAFEQAEHYGNAVWAYERASELFAEAGDDLSSANMLRFVGNLQRGFGDTDDSLESLARALDLVNKHDDRVAKVNVLEAMAFTKSQVPDAGALTAIDQAIELVRTDPEGPFDWKVADLVDSKARVLIELKRPEEAVAGFLTAADGYRAAGDLAATARAEHFAARSLAELEGRRLEAVVLWRQALATVEETDLSETSEWRSSILLALGDALEAEGDAAGAASVRAQLGG